MMKVPEVQAAMERTDVERKCYTTTFLLDNAIIKVAIIQLLTSYANWKLLNRLNKKHLHLLLIFGNVNNKTTTIFVSQFSIKVLCFFINLCRCQ